MKRRTRTFLFSSFIMLFAIAAPGIIAYSQGYRIDFTHLRIIETGALYLEPRPAPVDLYLNGKLKKGSNALFQNIFVSNLLPRPYQIEIKKEGYIAWKKNLSTSPKLVTEAKNILLFKNQYTSNAIFQRAENFSLSPSKNTLAVIKTNDTPEMYLIGAESKESRLILKSSNQFLNYRISSIQWNQDETFLLVMLTPPARDEKKGRAFPKWMAVNLRDQNSEAVDVTQLIANSNEFAVYTKNFHRPKIDNLQWSKSANLKIFFTVYDKDVKTLSSSLFAYDLKAMEMTPPLAYDILIYTLTERGAVVYISSLLHTLNFLDARTFEVQQVSFAPPMLLPRANDGDVSFIDAELPILKIGKTIYLLDEKVPSLQKIAEKVTSALLSSDKKKLLVATEDSFVVYWIRDVHVQPFHDAGESVSLAPQSPRILDALWLTKDNEHVIFAEQNSIKVTELDGRGGRNTVTLAENVEARNLSYDESRDILYYLAFETLYSMSLK